MVHSTQPHAIGPLQQLRQAFAQSPELPCVNLLPDDTAELLGQTSDSIYTPITTLWMFLAQLLDPVGSCTQAVARLIAWRDAQQLPTCHAGTGAYCKARQRLPEKALQTLVQRTGETLSQNVPTSWKWKNRTVRIVDGSTATAADTPANQAEYPQPDGQKPGLGFPMMRFVVLFCMASGAVLQTALAPYRGKGTGEISLLRKLWDHLNSGDVLVGDRIFCSYFEMALMRQRGVDSLFHKHQSRKTDFRTGQRLGKNDHVITWSKPVTCPDWMERAVYDGLPETLSVREVRVRVDRPGFRVKTIEIITTLLDPKEVRAKELGDLYRRRWEAELNLRSLKSSLGMDQLRCKSPAMVRKEMSVYLLGYNLVRGIASESALCKGVSVHRISFKGTVQTLLMFTTGLLQAEGLGYAESVSRLYKAVGEHRVGHRPDRVEPRAIKRRKKSYPSLSKPRKLFKDKDLRRK